MEHICVDKGSDNCPCILMESGQCYTCSMIRRGKCDCGSLWQGVCPYTEYLQGNKRIKKPVVAREYTLCCIKSYSPTLSVLTIETPIAFGLKCEGMGSFLMLKWKEWFVPISVLRVRLDYETQLSYIELAVNATGPKTIGILKSAMVGKKVCVKGPFYSGLCNVDSFRKEAPSLVIAKGIAVMPLINSKDLYRRRLKMFILDNSKLTDGFLTEYFNGIDFESVNLEEEAFEIAERLKEEYGYCFGENQRPNLFLMTSPYYVEKFLNLTGFSRKNVITPNHSNMCCGEGYCGSCSFSDKDGVTVKRCKCIDE